MIIRLEKLEDFIKTIKENKNVVVDFNATWCGPCRMMGRNIEEIEEKESDITFLKVDTDEFPQIAQQFAVMSIPTLVAFQHGKRIYFSHEGRKEDIILGALDVDALKEVLNDTFRKEN